MSQSTSTDCPCLFRCVTTFRHTWHDFTHVTYNSEELQVSWAVLLLPALPVALFLSRPCTHTQKTKNIAKGRSEAGQQHQEADVIYCTWFQPYNIPGFFSFPFYFKEFPLFQNFLTMAETWHKPESRSVAVCFLDWSGGSDVSQWSCFSHHNRIWSALVPAFE